MLYPSNIEQKIGFSQIKDLVAQYCLGSKAIDVLNKEKFLYDFESISKKQNQIFEFVNILCDTKRPFPSQGYLDMERVLSKLKIVGAYVTEDEWVDLRIFLKAIISCVQYFDHESSVGYIHLKEIIYDLEIDRGLIKTIDSVIDIEGKVKDNASPLLRELRGEMIIEQNKLRKKLESFLFQAQKNGFSDEEMTITVRNSRLVVPLKAEYKRKFKGFVHDESATGQTVFFEPEEVLELNNYIKELEYAEKREVLRILSSLSDQFKKHLPQLLKANDVLAIVDFVMAKAKLALDLNAENPIKSPKRILDWKGASHPLLLLTNKKQKKKTVPLSIQLTDENKILVISGPNAGGKSVCLKTVGLIQYMFQMGYPVPLKASSTMGVFGDVFVDIGDEQSIENDLSTYSSHLYNLNYFVKHGTLNSLILIDEFGTGTDPEYGGSIAEAILEKLNKNGVFAVLNTHYSNLKVFATQNKGVINGSMRYETELMEPLYELEIGKPGSSFALEIARKIGLSNEIIESAKSKIGVDKVKTELLLVQLEQQRNALEKKKLEFVSKEAALSDALKQYETLKEHIENNKTKLLNEAKIEAQNLVKETNKLIEKTIREIKENKAEKILTQSLRNNLDLHNKERLKIVEKSKPVAPKVVVENNSPIVVGSFVRIKGQDTVGEVLALKGGDAEVQLGAVKTNIKLSRLEKVSRKDLERSNKDTDSRPITFDIREKMISFRTDHDFRGMRAEEALNILERIMDDAIVLNAPEFRIIHGKGDGVLRNVLRARLKQFKAVVNVSDEHADHGGDGVTIVKLK